MNNQVKTKTNISMKSDNETTRSRRKVLSMMGAGVLITSAMPKKWVAPVVNSVMLPAHAQTSMCVTDVTAGGPLAGHPSGAANCQLACEAEAEAQNAQLCAVEEFVDSSNDTQCDCELDLPE